MTPLKRFYNLLQLDKKDVVQIFFLRDFCGIIEFVITVGYSGNY